MTTLPRKAVIVPLPARTADTSPALPSATTRQRLHAWSESCHDEPSIHLPDLPDELIQALPAAIAAAERDLEPGDPAEVLSALTALGSRRGFALPEGPALEMDVEILASWPRDLWRLALRRIWEDFAYRRLPEVADFKKAIEAEWAERQARLAKLRSLQLRLRTVRLRAQWDRETRRRHDPRWRD
jgi:hypothetical protein